MYSRMFHGNYKLRGVTIIIFMLRCALLGALLGNVAAIALHLKQWCAATACAARSHRPVGRTPHCGCHQVLFDDLMRSCIAYGRFGPDGKVANKDGKAFEGFDHPERWPPVPACVHEAVRQLRDVLRESVLGTAANMRDCGVTRDRGRIAPGRGRSGWNIDAEMQQLYVPLPLS